MLAACLFVEPTARGVVRAHREIIGPDSLFFAVLRCIDTNVSSVWCDLRLRSSV